VLSYLHKIVNKFGYAVAPININDLDDYYQEYPESSVKGRRFYNVGAGSFSHPAWTNVDFISDWYKHSTKMTLAGMNYDLLEMKPLPIDDASAEVVYTSHTIEHITDAAALNLFSESYRILRKGGFLRITTPNIDLEYAAYRSGDRKFFYWEEDESVPGRWEGLKYNKPMKAASLDQVFLAHFATSASTIHADGAPKRVEDEELRKMFSSMSYEDVLNYCTSLCPLDIQRKYPGNHINWWNFEKLVRMLKLAGFQDVYASAFGQSHCGILRNTYYFDSTHPKISLYVESRKN